MKAFLIIIGLIIFVSVKPAEAAINIPSNLWQGLIAEDVAGGYRGMYAVACCVRNRINAGMDPGLVALKRKDLNRFCRRQGLNYQRMAKKIVDRVFNQNSPDITGGGTHYEAVEKYGMPRWAKGMIKVCKVGEHTYFK